MLVPQWGKLEPVEPLTHWRGKHWRGNNIQEKKTKQYKSNQNKTHTHAVVITSNPERWSHLANLLPSAVQQAKVFLSLCPTNPVYLDLLKLRKVQVQKQDTKKKERKKNEGGGPNYLLAWCRTAKLLIFSSAYFKEASRRCTLWVFPFKAKRSVSLIGKN